MSVVYFVQIAPDGPIKIGTTQQSPSARVAMLQVGNPFHLQLLGARDGGPRNERWLHHHLFEHRMHGEWFRPTKEVMTTVESVLNADFAWPRGRGIQLGNRRPPLASISDRVDGLISGLLHRADEFCERHRVSRTRLGSAILNDPAFLHRLEAGADFRISTYDKVMSWLDAHEQLAGA